jgi:hypothetical protein
VFEERYKTMISRCLDERAPFGVALIRSGDEVGGDAEPYDVGTSTRIARVQRLPDGRMNLIVLGERRFCVLELHRTEPYLAASVEYLSSAGGSGAEASEAASRVAALFGEQYRLALAATGQWARRVDLPGEPDRVADFVASQLDVPMETKQELLETLSVPERLARDEELLGERIRELTERWDERRRKRFAGAVLN